MRLRGWTVGTQITMGLLAIAGPCEADGMTGDPSVPRLAVEEAQRPLTLPRFVLDPTATGELRHLKPSDVYGDFTGAVALGATDDLVVRALVLPLQLAAPAGDGLEYGQTSGTRGPGVGGTYRLVHGSVELGVGLDLRVFTAPDIRGGAIIPTIPLRIHAGDHLRIDIAPTVTVTRATSTATETVVEAGNIGKTTLATSTPAGSNSLEVPVTALYSFTPSLYLGLTGGLTISHLLHPRDSTSAPLGVFAGYTLAGKSGPVFDVEPFFTFPELVSSGAPSPTDTSDYTVGLRFRAFLYL